MKALLSVSDKTGLVDFAKGLVSLGYELISTGGTLKTLSTAGVPVISIDDVTGFPEMLDGRVKTLHPKIHGGLLAKRDEPAHVQACKDHQIEFIDLVVVNLYPFEATVAKPGVSFEEAIENIDIGGPSMLRSASKNHPFVGVVVNPDQYDALLYEMKANQGQLSLKTKRLLALEAFRHTARYDSIISDYLSKQFESEPATLPPVISPVLTKIQDLRYGENPHQSGAFYALSGEEGLAQLVQHHGKELSFNNLLDLDAAWHIVREFIPPAATVIKHNNPCGTALGDTLEEAYQKAFSADPVSAFGGIVGLNQPVDEATAKHISETFLEAVIAPQFSKEALAILSQKPSIRLITLPQFLPQKSPWIYRHIQGGFLIQSPDSHEHDPVSFQVVTTATPDADLLLELHFAFSLVKHIKSNAIVVTSGLQSLGIGAGQMSRVEAVEIALKKAGEKTKGAVLASDAFFPFKDSVELAAKAGIKAIIQPGGSKKDQESIDACNAHGLCMVFTGIRHFKH
jgi:phosphoribosylaminoimidazolecarboxamide formyltransferase/IMP cyclohydrolase